jgi:hypothetical protein
VIAETVRSLREVIEHPSSGIQERFAVKPGIRTQSQGSVRSEMCVAHK